LTRSGGNLKKPEDKGIVGKFGFGTLVEKDEKSAQI
jgi:hypothetical protein